MPDTNKSTQEVFDWRAQAVCIRRARIDGSNIKWMMSEMKLVINRKNNIKTTSGGFSLLTLIAGSITLESSLSVNTFFGSSRMWLSSFGASPLLLRVHAKKKEQTTTRDEKSVQHITWHSLFRRSQMHSLSSLASRTNDEGSRPSDVDTESDREREEMEN